jgi:hypothetical protein
MTPTPSKSASFGIAVSINSGAALLLFLLAFFLLTFWAGGADRRERIYPVAVGTLAGAFTGYLIKRNSNNKIEAETERQARCGNGGER